MEISGKISAKHESTDGESRHREEEQEPNARCPAGPDRLVQAQRTDELAICQLADDENHLA